MLRRTSTTAVKSVWNRAASLIGQYNCRYVSVRVHRQSPEELPSPRYTHQKDAERAASQSSAGPRTSSSSSQKSHLSRGQPSSRKSTYLSRSTKRNEESDWRRNLLQKSSGSRPADTHGSYRHSPGRRERESNDQERILPRYLRREAQFGQQPSVDDESSSKNVQSSRFPSSTPRRSESNQDMRLLEPHVLSARLKRLCDSGKVDEAVSMLKNAPLDAQNTPVWNTLIWECMKVKRFSLAYQLFIDMKRRGFSPTTRSYQTMLSGLSRIELWSSHPKQLANAKSLYEAFCRHLESIKNEDSSSPELSTTPLTFYVKILGDAGKHQEVFDVYYAMDSTGPLAPNQFIFTSMFNAIAKRKNEDMPIGTQNAFDAKLLWNQMLKASERNDFPVDDYVISAAINALSRGRAVDHTFAFNIAREYLGLLKPGDAKTAGKFSLTPAPFATILALCNSCRKYDLSILFFRQVLTRSDKLGGPEIIDKAHVEELLKSYVSLAARGSPDEANQALQTLEWMLRQEVSGSGPKIRPAASTFKLVLMACWRGRDWSSAARTFELMTGYKAVDFLDGVVRPRKMEQRSAGRNLIPDAEAMSSLLRAALTDGPSSMRQCLRMVTFMAGENLFEEHGSREEIRSRKAAKQDTFYRLKLATAIKDTVDHVLGKLKNTGRTTFDSMEVARWESLAEEAVEVLRKTTPSFVTPYLEQDVEVLDHTASASLQHETTSDGFLLYKSDTTEYQ